MVLHLQILNDTQLVDPWQDGLSMFCWWISTHLLGEIGGKNKKLSLIPGWYISCDGHPNTAFWEGILCSASARLYKYFSALNSWLHNTACMMRGCTCPPVEYSHNIPKRVLQGSTLYTHVSVLYNLWIKRLILCPQFVLCCTCKTYESKGWLVLVLWHCCCKKSLLCVLISSKYSLFHDVTLLLWEYTHIVLWA
jgi:hypothetical protein